MIVAPRIDASRGSGGGRPRAPHPLPRAFVALDSATLDVLGAFCVSECVSLSIGGELFFKVDRFVRLEPSVRVNNHDFAWRSTIHHLRPAMEQALRGAPVANGSVLRTQLVDFAGSRLRVWPMTAAEIATSSHGPFPYTLRAPVRFAKALKVDPEIVRLRSHLLMLFL
jgi:hypothetical protein